MPFVFLVCSERSGSNLITRIIDSHPEFCGPSPSHLFRTFSRNLWRYGNIEEMENWHILCNDIVDFLNCQLGLWRTRFSMEQIVEEVEQHTLAAVIRYIYEAEACANRKSRLFVKENQTYSFLPFLLASFPDAKFVFMVRDPRDMSLSLKLSTATPGGVHRAARLWKTDQENSIEIYGFLRNMGRIWFIRYEDLLSNTSEELERLCHFLGVDYQTEMLDFYTDELTIKNSKRIEAWHNLENPILKNNFKKYRTGCSELEICYIESLCATEMEILGYRPDFECSNDLALLETQLLEYEENEAFKNIKDIGNDEKVIRADRISVIERIIKRRLWENSSDF